MRDATLTEAPTPSGGSSGTEESLSHLEDLSRRLHERDLMSIEQVELLDGLASELGRLAREDPEAALPLLSIAFSAMEFQRLITQQAQAAGTVARVRSAVPLSQAERNVLRDQLRDSFGEEFLLHLEVDPSLIGGVVVEAKGHLIDGSLSGRLDALEEHLRSVLEERK